MRYSADFETTTDKNDCRVWAIGFSEIKPPFKFQYGNSIEFCMRFMQAHSGSSFYFQNAKFDFEFIFVYLLTHGFTHVDTKKELKTKTFTTLITALGQFYSCDICFYKDEKINEHVTLYDSLKLLPFSVEKTAKAFGLPIEKQKIDYDEYRPEGHILNSDEVKYLRMDCEIVARALHVLFEQKMNKMTTAANALHDYKLMLGEKKFKKLYPSNYNHNDIKQCYKGGFTYVNKRFQGKELGSGIVLDVNSLYPSVMYDCLLPYGEPIFFEGKYKKDKLYPLYIQMITCSFEVKENHIPTIQLKNSAQFAPTEYLESSHDEEVTLCLTNVDLELFLEHYHVYDLVYHSGYKLKGARGLFKDYIDKWIKVKEQATIDGNDGMRTLSKLMLNSLYGKFATNPIVRSKEPYYEDRVRYRIKREETREPVYMPMAAFITAYARHKTISSAQKLFDRFIYADTDSLHLLGTRVPENLEISPTKLGAWKHESTFTKAKYIRQKTYIEEIDGKLKITCAGMPSRCYENVTWDNFTEGSSFAGKLIPEHVEGGIVLSPTLFTIKGVDKK